ncbi:MAG: hypothetical protein CL820_09410 [Croceicoccus sp.]|nr:hypothetical protein [Croceicoccus sp.]
MKDRLVNIVKAIAGSLFIIFLLETLIPYSDYVWRSKVLKAKSNFKTINKISQVIIFVKICFYATLPILLLFSLNDSMLAIYIVGAFMLAVGFLNQLDNKYLK